MSKEFMDNLNKKIEDLLSASSFTNKFMFYFQNGNKKIEDLLSAMSFAEAGEFDTAREILREEERPRKTERTTPSKRVRKELRAPEVRT